MNTTVTLDSAGRVLIPKLLREELALQPGDTLALNSEGEQVVLRPVRTEAALRKKQGAWVFKAGAPLPAAATDKALAEVRRGQQR